MSTSPYHEAGKLMNLILTHKKSIKTVAFSKSKLTCSKSAYATVCNAIQRKPLLDSILNHDGGELRKAVELDQARNQGLIYVLLYELLFGPYGNIRGGGKLKRIILKHEAALRGTKEKIVQESSSINGTNSIGESTNNILPPKFPRYVRVNTLKSSMEEIVKELHHLFEKHNVTQRDIYLDAHVPDLIVLPPTCPLPWHELEMVQKGRVILQDKSSCFSALALVHGHQKTSISSQHQGDFIDACAAPGNKTSHLAALLYKSCFKDRPTIKNPNNTPQPCKIFALDRSSSRHSILKKRMMQLAPRVSDPHDKETHQKAPKQNSTFPVELCTLHQDFLQVNPQDKLFRNVRAVLLDPSCSGSGIVNAPDRMADAFQNEKNKTALDDPRIQSLSNFQLVALKHAMSFPQVDQIVYSTCSVHVQENEDVVAMALKETNDTISDKNLKWKLVPPRILSTWKRRGIHPHTKLTLEESNSMIRVNGLDGDETNGFFVSYFERVRMGNGGDKDNNIQSDNGNEYIPKESSTGIKGIYRPGKFPTTTSIMKRDVLSSSTTKRTTTTSKKSTSKPTPSTSTTGNEASSIKQHDKKTLPKKIAKKLEWKRKQMERKRQRLQTNSSSTTPITKK